MGWAYAKIPSMMGLVYGQKVKQILYSVVLRIPDSYDAKIAEICNLLTFWPVIQLINDIYKI